MARPPLPDDYDDMIQRVRDRLDLPEPLVDYAGADDETAVQLSVRLSPRLRHDVAQVARRRRQSVTAFVIEALEDAVRIENDPFAAIAAKTTAELRSKLARAVESGAYAEAAAEVDDEEGWAEPA